MDIITQIVLRIELVRTTILINNRIKIFLYHYSDFRRFNLSSNNFDLDEYTYCHTSNFQSKGKSIVSKEIICRNSKLKIKYFL